MDGGIDMDDLREAAAESAVNGFAHLELAMIEAREPRRSSSPMISKSPPPPPGPIR